MATARTIGNMVVNLLFNDKGMTTGAKNAKTTLRTFGREVSDLSKGLDRQLTRALTVATTAMVGLGTSAAVTGATFEKTMAEVGAVSGSTADELARLSEEARRIGASTNFTATEVSQAMIQLGRAGQSTAEIMESTNKVMALAGANNFGLAESAGVVAASLKQFNLSTKETGRVVDVFTRINQKSLFSMESLAEAMKFAGTTGQGLGLSLEETAAATAQFVDLGLEGSMVGTNFRMAMSALINPTEKARKALDRLGLTSAEINPQLVGFGGSMTALGEAGLTAADAIDIVGLRAGLNIQQISTSFAEGRSNFEELMVEMVGSAGTAERTYRKMMDNLSGQFDIFKSAVEEAFLVVFDQIGPPLKRFFEEMGTRVSVLAQAFSALGDDRIKNALDSIVDSLLELFDTTVRLLPQLKLAGELMFGAFVIVRGISLITQLGAVATSIKAIGAALLASFGPAGVIVAAIAGIVALTASFFSLNAQMREANREADRLAGSQAAVMRMREEEQKRIELITPLIERQAKAAQERLLGEKNLSDAEQARLRTLSALTAKEAVRMEQQGRLVISENNLVLVGQAAAELGRDAIEFAKTREKLTEKQINKNNALIATLKSIQEGEERMDGMRRGTEESIDAASRAMGRQVTSMEQVQTEITSLQLTNQKLEESARALNIELVKELNALDNIDNSAAEAAEAARAYSNQLRDLAEAGASAVEALDDLEARGIIIGESAEAVRKRMLRELEQDVGRFAGDMQDQLTEAFTNAAIQTTEDAGSIMQAGAAQFSKEWETALEDMEAATPGPLQKVVDLFVGAFSGSVGVAIETFITAATTGIAKLFAQVTDLASEIPGFIGAILESALGPAMDIVELITGTVQSFIDLTAEAAKLREEADVAEAEGDPERAGALREEATELELAAEGNQFINDLIDGGIEFISVLQERLPGIIDDLLERVPEIILVAAAQLPSIVGSILESLPGVIEVVESLVEEIAVQLPDLINAVLPLLPPIFDALATQVPLLIDAITAQINPIIDAVMDNLPAIIDALIRALPVLWVELELALIEIGLSVFLTIFARVPAMLAANAGAILEALWDTLKDMGARIGEGFLGIAGRIFGGLFSGQDSDNDGRADGFFARLFGGGGDEVRAQSGIDFVPRTMRTVLEPGEAVIDAMNNARRLAGGEGFGTEFTPPGPGFGDAAAGGSSQRDMLEVLVSMDSQVVDAQLFQAADMNRAPRIQRALRQRPSGVKSGFKRGKFNSSGK